MRGSRLFLGNPTTGGPAPPTDPYGLAVYNDGPVWWARLGEPSGTTAADEIGSLDGTYTNSPTLGEPGALSGNSNTAVKFNENGVGTAYIAVPDGAALDLGDGPLTYEVWIKRTEITQHESCIISKGSGTPILLLDSASLGSLSWYARGVDVAADSSVAITGVDDWYYIVGTKDSSDNWLLYVNAVDVTVFEASPSTSSNATEMNIGRDNGSTPGSYAELWIDEPAIYSYVLSPAQIASHNALGRQVRYPATIRSQAVVRGSRW